jgi:hypothetical protein
MNSQNIRSSGLGWSDLAYIMIKVFRYRILNTLKVPVVADIGFVGFFGQPSLRRPLDLMAVGLMDFHFFLGQIRTKICKSNFQGFVCNLQYAYVPLMKNADCEEFYTKVKLKLSLVLRSMMWVMQTRKKILAINPNRSGVLRHQRLLRDWCLCSENYFEMFNFSVARHLMILETTRCIC